MPDSLEITVEAYANLKFKNTPHVLIDVREPWETKLCTIKPSINHPLGSLSNHLEELKTFAQGKKIIVYCHHGVRSLKAACFLRSKEIPALSLKGGIDAWAQKIDPSLERY